MTDLLRTPYELKLTNIEKYPYIFPRVSKSILNKLRMTDIALYSMITSDNATYLCDLLDDILKQYNIDISKLKGLDLGCNTGGILYYFLQKCAHMTGIEFEPLHVEICHHNIQTLDKQLLKKLTLLYGDVEEIFMGGRINISNAKYFNEKYVKPRTKNSKALEDIGLVYIGTPFIDLKYGNTRVELLILKIQEIYNPTIIIVQLPCSIYNDVHNVFYKTTLYKTLKMVNHAYDISFMFDYKQNNKCSNLHLILVKRKKNSIKRDDEMIHLKGEYKLQTLLNTLVNKFNIKCYKHKFNMNIIWRPLYYESYYINVVYNNNKLTFNSKTLGENGDVEPAKFKVVYEMTDDEKNKSNKQNNIKCRVKYDRFKNVVSKVIVV